MNRFEDWIRNHWILWGFAVWAILSAIFGLISWLADDAWMLVLIPLSLPGVILSLRWATRLAPGEPPMKLGTPWRNQGRPPPTAPPSQSEERPTE